MKKIWMILAVLFMAVIIPVSVKADSNSGVWSDVNVTDDSAEVNVSADGTVVDGFFILTYDKDVVSCAEEDISFGDSVELYSSNVEDGVVKLVFVSENPINAGEICKVKFSPAKEGAKLDKSSVDIKFTGEAHNAEGGNVEVKADVPYTGEEKVTLDKVNKPIEKVKNYELTEDETINGNEVQNNYKPFIIAGIILVVVIIICIVAVYSIKRFNKKN